MTWPAPSCAVSKYLFCLFQDIVKRSRVIKSDAEFLTLSIHFLCCQQSVIAVSMIISMQVKCVCLTLCFIRVHSVAHQCFD